MNFLILKNFSRRVVISGMGMVSPLGNNVKENWKNMKDLKSGIRDLSQEPYAKDLPQNCKIGATVNPNFDSRNYRTLVSNSVYKGYR
jgi:3-oxoacyl-[acyl-carrier-protein] synthase II